MSLVLSMVLKRSARLSDFLTGCCTLHNHLMLMLLYVVSVNKSAKLENMQGCCDEQETSNM